MEATLMQDQSVFVRCVKSIVELLSPVCYNSINILLYANLYFFAGSSR